MGGLAAPSAAADAPQLHPRVASIAGRGPSLALPDEDRQWLWQRRTLRVGVSRPDAPPFDVLGNGQHYEGISAEYVQLLSQLLHLDVQIVAFAGREAALAALRAGDIDLLTGANGEEVGLAGLVRSLPYAADEPVLVKRADRPADGRGRGEALEVERGYASMASAGELAPGYTLRATPSLLTGLAAVALGQADALLGNARSVAAQLGQSPLSGREQVRFLTPRPAGMAFLLRANDSRLLGLVNAGLAAATRSWREQVDETWSRGAVRLSEVAPVVLQPEERGWMAAHPKVRVGYLREFAPLSFESEKGVFRGLAADLLGRIGQRTGLAFEPVALDSHAALLRALEHGEVDLAAAMASTAGAQAGLRLSRAWLSAVPVLVAGGAAAPAAALDDAAGQVIVVPASLGLTATLAQRWPVIQWQERATAREAVDQVTGQGAVGAVLPYVQARAMLAGSPGQALRIAGALPLAPRRYAFAAQPGQQPLLAILDQALLSFDPASLDDMARRWRSEVHVEPQWPTQARWLVPAFGVAGAMLLLAVVWIRVLRRQVRRRRAAEHALTDQLEFMRVMIDGTPHPVYVRDRGGRLLNCNASYLSALGVEREAVISQKVTRIPLVNEQAREYEALYRKVIADGQPIVEDRQLRLRNGRYLTVFHWMLPFRASNGSIVGLIGGWIDITERQRLYDALQTAKEAADAANRAKSRFLATASHEIRTPMNAVLGMLELALRKAAKGELDTLALQVASESASGLLELLSDILDISRIESGHLALNPKPVDIHALATQVVQLYQAKAREKGLRLELALGAGTDGGVLLDPLRFQQILGNLLSNAIKFTREGGVTVSLDGEVEGNELALRLVVQDTGIGIPQGDLGRLCQPYQQAGNHQVSGRAGAGLGLSISQHLCRIMGGSLELSSREGEGSRVQARLRLPTCELTTPALCPGAAPTAQAPISVLVVDDHEPNRVLLAQQLSYLGHQVTVAVDGAHGLREWCGRGGFDAVICDCEMPGLDGYDLARAIRLEEQRKGLAPCRLLACTADASGGQRERSREAGMDECLTKPLGLEALAAALVPTTPPVPRSNAAAGAPHSPAPEALLGLAGGCVTSARRLRDSLVEALAQDYQRLCGLCAGSPEVDDVVHRIKGGARIVGATLLVEGCEAVERGESSLPALLAQIECLQRQLRGMRFSPASATGPEGPGRSAPATRPKPAA
ncbi:transporter substrate-binding domain-containing protein [Pseudomonas entomophila]|uniref:ATP-binding protein n=1 Tax=Pseudomonas sp. RIT-PI-S TaxID=3035295 RepID=UPI0021D85D70